MPEKFAYGTVARHAPEADTLAGPPYGPLQARRATLTEGGSERMIYAVPHARTLSGQHTADTGRPAADEMRYVMGDIDQNAPGEVNSSWPRMERFTPVQVHPDDAPHHNRVMRTAARGAGPDDPTAHLVGLEGTDGR